MLAFLGLTALANSYRFFNVSAMVLGPVCLVSVTWSLIRHKPASGLQFWTSVSLGILLLTSLYWYQVSYLGIIIQSFCILLVMLISILGLAARQKSALYLIIAMVLYALIAKAGKIPLPMVPKDMEHYLLTLTLVSIGKAFNTEFRYIF
ncbi:hypothetical protein [Dyadobacter tibetensis]|uniref:hypothetical protein n=1 Tax=Dyadobacter tibetensis TaxID=1211851 RepID=UPI0010399114|nr:hypothetical protein [Dyadobacter tibetensis]